MLFVPWIYRSLEESFSEILKKYSFGLVLGFAEFLQVFQVDAENLALRFDQSVVFDLFATNTLDERKIS